MARSKEERSVGERIVRLWSGKNAYGEAVVLKSAKVGGG